MISRYLEELKISIEDSTDKEIADAVRLSQVAELAVQNALDTLICLFMYGPVYDGDVPSKTERDWLVKNGLAAKVIFKGEDGYQALTYKGAKCYRLWAARRDIRDSKK